MEYDVVETSRIWCYDASVLLLTPSGLPTATVHKAYNAIAAKHQTLHHPTYDKVSPGVYKF